MCGRDVLKGLRGGDDGVDERVLRGISNGIFG